MAGFAAITRPLHELMTKGCRFEWTGRHEVAFKTFKRKLTEDPILASPRDEGIYYLDTDASDYPWEPSCSRIKTEIFELSDMPPDHCQRLKRIGVLRVRNCWPLSMVYSNIDNSFCGEKIS